MANVRFIRGTGNSIATQSIQDGTVWLATDTNTLYIDTENNRISFSSPSLDEIVEEVLSALPAAESVGF